MTSMAPCTLAPVVNGHVPVGPFPLSEKYSLSVVLVNPNNIGTGNGVAWYADDPDEGHRRVVIWFVTVSIAIMMITDRDGRLGPNPVQ